MSTAHFQSGNTDHTFFARWIRRLAVPIILGWLALVFVLNTAIPSLEDVGKARTVSMSPTEAPSMIAMTRMGELFDEGDSDNIAMIVLKARSRWAPRPTATTTKFWKSCATTPSMCRVSRTSGVTRSPRPVHRAPTARPPMCR